MPKLKVDDLLGPAKKKRFTKKPVVDDLLGPAPKKLKKTKAVKATRKYEPLPAPKEPAPDGIFALREKKGKNLGRTCLICKDELKHSGRGRPPVICKKKSCFRAYRNAYRHDYDKVRAA
jgi:hypothetical protein